MCAFFHHLGEKERAEKEQQEYYDFEEEEYEAPLEVKAP